MATAGRVAQDRAFLLELGRRLASLRRKEKLTQAQLADRAGLTVRYISMVETGRRNPTILVLSDMALALRIRVRDLTDPG